MDLALNSLQRLICHKYQPTNQPTNQPIDINYLFARSEVLTSIAI